MKTINILFTLLVLVTCQYLLSLSYSNNHGNKNVIEDMKWLLGVWENHTPRGIMYESWKQVNESELFGKSYVIKAKDTTVLETVRLVQKGDDVMYIPIVNNQNSGEPVVFKSTFVSPSKFIVEAPEHDFPQKISYTRIAQDQFVAEISGEINGVMRYQSFSLKSNLKSKNIELVRSVFRNFNEHKWRQMADLYANPAEFKDPTFGFDIVIQSQEQIIHKYEQMEKMSFDIQDTIVELYATEDKHIIVEFVSSGSNSDGSKWQLPLVTIFTIENNLITKEFTYYDKP